MSANEAPLVPHYIRISAMRSMLQTRFPEVSYADAEILAEQLFELAVARMEPVHKP